MAEGRELTPPEAADRLAIRELFDAYAHCSDRRDAEGQKALFTPDTRFAPYMDGGTAIRGRWRMSASDPGFMLRNDGFVYFEKGNLEPRVFCPGVLGGSVPGGSVPGGTSVELGAP